MLSRQPGPGPVLSSVRPASPPRPLLPSARMHLLAERRMPINAAGAATATPPLLSNNCPHPDSGAAGSTGARVLLHSRFATSTPAVFYTTATAAPARPAAAAAHSNADAASNLHPENVPDNLEPSAHTPETATDSTDTAACGAQTATDSPAGASSSPAADSQLPHQQGNQSMGTAWLNCLLPQETLEGILNLQHLGEAVIISHFIFVTRKVCQAVTHPNYCWPFSRVHATDACLSLCMSVHVQCLLSCRQNELIRSTQAVWKELLECGDRRE